MSTGNKQEAATVPSRLRTWLFYLTLGSCSGLVGLVFSAVAPVLPALAAHFGGGPGGMLSAQLVMAVSTIGIIAGALPAGWLIERTGGQIVILGSFGLYAVSGTAPLFLDNEGALLISRLVLGMASGGIITAAVVLIGQSFQGEARERFLGYANIAGAAVGVLTGITAGVLGSNWGWRAPFAMYVIGGVLLLGGISAARVEPQTTLPGSMVRRSGASVTASLWPIYLTILVAYVVVFMTTTQVAFLLVANGTSDPATMGGILAGAALLMGCGAWSYRRLARGFDSGKVLALALVLLGTGCVLMGLIAHPAFTFIGCCLTGFGGGLLNVYFPMLLMGLVPEAARGRALGLLYTAQFLGDFINPFVIYPLRAAMGIHGAFVAVGVFMFAGAFAAVVRGGFDKYRPRSDEVERI